MAKVYTICNQKGGVGKSTTSINLLAGLAQRGYKCLGIDLDSQLCLTTTLQGKTDGASSLSVLLKEAPIERAIQHTEEVDLVAASRGLAMADTLLTKTGKEYLLKEALESIQSKYDFIVIDTSPALGVLTINALTVADSLIIPIQADTYSLDGVEFLIETVAPVKKYCNPALTIEGLLFTMYDPRSVISKEVMELATQFAKKIDSKVFKSTIRRAVAVREAQANQESLFKYDPRAKVTEDYKHFIEELLDNGKESNK